LLWGDKEAFFLAGQANPPPPPPPPPPKNPHHVQVVREQVVLPGVLDHVRRVRRLRVHEHDGPTQRPRVARAQPRFGRLGSDAVDGRRRHPQAAVEQSARQVVRGLERALSREAVALALAAQGGAAGDEAAGERVELGARGGVGERRVERRREWGWLRRRRPPSGRSFRCCRSSSSRRCCCRSLLRLLLPRRTARHFHPCQPQQRRAPRQLVQLERRPARAVPRFRIIRPQPRRRLRIPQGMPPVT
jgi:hypothetical protein